MSAPTDRASRVEVEELTDEMIEAGAQRLFALDQGFPTKVWADVTEGTKQTFRRNAGLIVSAALLRRPTTPSLPLSALDLEGLEKLCEEADWPVDGRFTFFDEPGEHDPCYVVMPGGSSLPVNHHAKPGVDIARARFIVDACNAALAARTALPKALSLAGLMDEAAKVLGPVALESDRLEVDGHPDGESVWSDSLFTYGDLRAARSLHAKFIALRDGRK